MTAPTFRTLTPDECDRLIRRARVRMAERTARGGWIRFHLQWQTNLSSGVESRHARLEGPYVLESSVGGAQPQATGAGVAPGLLNNFRPAIPAKEDAALCAGSTSSIHAHVEREGGAN